MSDPIRAALERLVAAEKFIGEAGPEYQQARDAARAALANPDGPTVPAPPASEEVGELAAKLRRLAPQNPLGTADPTITRTADLLEQQQGRIAELEADPIRKAQAAVDDLRVALSRMNLEQMWLKPVPVGERPPGPEDCDAEGRCWWFVPTSVLPNGICPYWCLAPAESPRSWFTHWLPAHALPHPTTTPAGQEGV